LTLIGKSRWRSASGSCRAEQPQGARSRAREIWRTRGGHWLTGGGDFAGCCAPWGAPLAASPAAALALEFPIRVDVIAVIGTHCQIARKLKERSGGFATGVESGIPLRPADREALIDAIRDLQRQG
jgi:hypothetical protein